MSEVFVLSKSIRAHDEELHALELRALTPVDARVIGELPYWVAGDGSVRASPDVAAKYLVRLAGIPMSSVDQLCPPDFNKLCWEVAGFFLSQEQSTSASSSGLPTT